MILLQSTLSWWMVLLVAWSEPPAFPEAAPTPQAAWQRLMDGNARFAADRLAPRDVGSKRRAELAQKQRPFAVVLTCADSRVVPEIIFDQGLGDLFVCRVAGNVAEPGVVGSVEYAVEHLHCPLVIVLGHERCGAVEAALQAEKPAGDLGWLVRQVHVNGKKSDDGVDLSTAVRDNALYQARELSRRSAAIRELVEHGRVRIVAGSYALATGTVTELKP